MPKEFYITADQSGRRIDRLLRGMWPWVPLGAVMKAIRTGEVRLDARKVKPDTRVEEGQFLQVPWDDAMPEQRTPDPDIKIRVKNSLETIYRDEYLWIINKPAGLLTQPDTKGGDSLITRVLTELAWTRSDFRPSTVQRLDRNTSGAVIVALTGPSLRHLSELIRERKIKKIYRAVVRGRMKDSGEIDLPLLKDPSSNTVRTDPDGQRALTRYRRISSGSGWSGIEAELVTGRPHQARVHLAAVGHPIIGDIKYGGDAKKAKRPLLHAYSLLFPDDAELPQDIRGREFKTPLPKDMEEYFNEM
ncbi:MAG TPA: RluA family pseudouridine synthase [Synergistaceae bacterium]|jgi:23S rRNA pseudouridine955/2504/2580 synthase|nr:RluA family pseudouridine synthase [Synergistaceae bacterium]NLL40240.1 RluA family pseudouridine synthase [Synergistaceae bacterium]HPX03969.1 RluA family pseudouridine synthase [Synergistaceae bacterium]HQA54912.1 RluA family pseudouridine synthase [Synergistaceae bacterium]